MGWEKKESCLDPLLSPSKMIHAVITSHRISGLTAISEPFLHNLAHISCRLTDVSFRNCSLFTPIPGPPLPSFQVHGKKWTSRHSNTGFLSSQLLPITCHHLPHNNCPTFPWESPLASYSSFRTIDYSVIIGCNCAVNSQWMLLHFLSEGLSTSSVLPPLIVMIWLRRCVLSGGFFNSTVPTFFASISTLPRLSP